MKTRYLFGVFSAALTLLVACTATPSAKLPAPADWLEWQARRRESLGGTNGWTTLVGLYWLHDGRNFIGAAPTNDVVLPSIPKQLEAGCLTRVGQSVRFDAAPGTIALIAGQAIKTALLDSDKSDSPTRLQLGSLSLIIIERGERIGLRVRDPNAPSRRHFRPPECFAYDPRWRLIGRFVPWDAPRVVRVADVTGGTQELRSPGCVQFVVNGQSVSLDTVAEPGEKDLFILFHDLTAGSSTYHAGRFLYVHPPGADNSITLDFNRAFSPPCAFTAFATCPLPPRQNWLPFAVPAGERAPAGH